MLSRYLNFSARSPILTLSFVATLAMMLFAFPALPLNGGTMIDLMNGYTYGEIVEVMEIYGEDGRRSYALASPTLDTLFPIAYVTFFAGLLYRLRPKEELWWFALIPMALGLVDLVENGQITAMLVSYPDITGPQVAAASLTTQIKNAVTLATYLAVVAVGVIALTRWATAKRRNNAQS